MQPIPDVVGLELEKAVQLLKPLDLHIYLCETHAPKNNDKNGECRVIRQTKVNNTIELIISYF